MAVRVLIADGSWFVRNAIRHYFECIGCEVVAEVENAGQILQLVRTVRPELVALGIGVPHGECPGALSLLRLIRSNAPETSVVMLCGKNAADGGQRFMSEGALDCVAEPFDNASFDHLWRKLSSEYPELKAHHLSTLLSLSEPRQREDKCSAHEG